MRRDAAANRRRVLEAAQAVFSEHGLEASVDMVIEAAGVGTGTFYRRFPNKEALISELVSELVDQVVNLALRSLSDHAGNGTALEDFLFAAGRQCEIHAAWSHRLWAGGIASRISPDRQATLEACLADLLAAARKVGEVGAQVTVADVRDAIRAVDGIVNSHADGSDWRRHMGIWLAGVRPTGGDRRAASTAAVLSSE